MFGADAPFGGSLGRTNIFETCWAKIISSSNKIMNIAVKMIMQGEEVKPSSRQQQRSTAITESTKEENCKSCLRAICPLSCLAVWEKTFSGFPPCLAGVVSPSYFSWFPPSCKPQEWEKGPKYFSSILNTLEFSAFFNCHMKNIGLGNIH